MEYNDTMDAQKISAIKAQRGIEYLEVLYSQYKMKMKVKVKVMKVGKVTEMIMNKKMDNR